ncbi:MAG: VanZ family protein [Alphaproteobacteria bacterium]|nr:VanZ family protein [Alphaproteobacteria bacterium]
MKWTTSAALYLFWPALVLVCWGELTPHPPRLIEHFWDKSLHFTAYFGLAAMATLVLGSRKRLLGALLALIVFGGVLEILQGYTGRDPDLLDELANALGVVSGFVVAWAFAKLLKDRELVAGEGRD